MAADYIWLWWFRIRTHPLFCSCKISGGPAGNFEVHDRECRIARYAERQGMATEDPQTGWVAIT